MPAVSQEQPNRRLIGAVLRNIYCVNSCHICLVKEKAAADWLTKVCFRLHLSNYYAQLDPNETSELPLCLFLQLTHQFHKQFIQSTRGKNNDSVLKKTQPRLPKVLPFIGKPTSQKMFPIGKHCLSLFKKERTKFTI